MLTYQVRVSNTGTYLWGGASIARDATLPFYLFCRVDEFGEPVELTTESEAAGAQPVRLGSLKPSEVYILSLDQLARVHAKTIEGQVDSLVWCTVLGPNGA